MIYLGNLMSSRILSNIMLLAGLVIVLVAADSIDNADAQQLAQSAVIALAGTALMIGGAITGNKE